MFIDFCPGKLKHRRRNVESRVRLVNAAALTAVDNDKNVVPVSRNIFGKRAGHHEVIPDDYEQRVFIKALLLSPVKKFPQHFVRAKDGGFHTVVFLRAVR